MTMTLKRLKWLEDLAINRFEDDSSRADDDEALLEAVAEIRKLKIEVRELKKRVPPQVGRYKMNTPYAFVITKDVLHDEDMTVMGPWNTTVRFPDVIRAGSKFRMLDDDGIVYYEGFFLGDDKSEDAFGPLDDYGAPNAGCTEIQYLNNKGEWETL